MVLILVVMEYGRWVGQETIMNHNQKCLNPCCNGIWSVGVKDYDNN